MTKKDIKGVFRKSKIQINKEALDLITDTLRKKVESIALRCKSGNIKRLTTDLFYLVK